ADRCPLSPHKRRKSVRFLTAASCQTRTQIDRFLLVAGTLTAQTAILLALLHLVHEGISPEGPPLQASSRSVLVTLPGGILGSSALPTAICGARENDIAGAPDY